jgi:hypothetical protein
MKTQVNMTLNNVPHHHIIFKIFLVFLDHEVMDMPWKFLKHFFWHHTIFFHFFFPLDLGVMDMPWIFFKVLFFSHSFVNFFFFHAIHHDVHVCMLHLYKIYINAHIHQTLNPRPHGNTPRSYPPNHFKILLIKKKKF